jgi:hypothetical protein
MLQDHFDADIMSPRDVAVMRMAAAAECDRIIGLIAGQIAIAESVLDQSTDRAASQMIIKGMRLAADLAGRADLLAGDR